MHKRWQRLKRPFLIGAAAVIVMIGAGGSAALYFAPHALPALSGRDSDGVDCRIVATMKDVDRDGLTVRYYIATEPVDERLRLQTALRVAKSLEQEEKAHLVQVSVVDAGGPRTVAYMRGRAIGAQVTLVTDAVSEAEKEAPEVSGYTIQGVPGSDGEFHGLRFEALQEDLDEMVAGFGALTGCSSEPQS